MFSVPLPEMCNEPACHGSFICCDMPFTYMCVKKCYFYRSCLFFSSSSFFSFFTHLGWLGQGGPCSLEELHTVCNMDGLVYSFGLPSPFLPVPWWCLEGEAAGHGSSIFQFFPGSYQVAWHKCNRRIETDQLLLPYISYGRVRKIIYFSFLIAVS